MTFMEFFVLVGIFIGIMLLYSRADKWIKAMDPKTVKIINWTGFAIGALGGIAWYVFKTEAYMFITLFGVILYFLFYSYDESEEKPGSKAPTK